jgi:hypothetical protein
MSDPIPNTPDPLAIALSKLDPAPHGFDRDALMFAAGRESKAWTIKCWQTLAAAAFIAAAAFGYLYFSHAKALSNQRSSLPNATFEARFGGRIG